MGWLKDAWNNVTDWVREKIVEPVVDWVGQLIQDTTTMIRIWRHEANKVLAKWLENDWAAFGLILATLVIASFWPQITTWLGKLSVTIALKAAWKEVKDGLKDILDFVHIIELDAINTVLKILWPDWRAMMGQIAEVTSQLAKELGKGTEYLHAYFSVIHGIAIVENAFIGADPKLGELQAFEDTDAGLRKINDKFWTYAENPSLIVPDIIEDFYLPRAENIRIAQQDVIESARNNRDKIVRINTALHDFEGRLTHFIEMTPEELSEIISERLQPIADALSDGLEVMDTFVMPTINGILDTLALREERQQIINDNILSRIDDPYQLLLQAEYMRDEDREALEEYIGELESRAADREQIEAKAALDAAAAAMIEATKDRYVEAPPVEQPRRTALSFETPGIPDPNEIPSWFVGEY